jgi:transposase
VIDGAAIKARVLALAPFLDERGRRLLAAGEAMAAGYGGITAVAQATGVARSTIGRGLAELRHGHDAMPGWARRAGGGRKAEAAKDPGLSNALLALIEPALRGDPQAPLLWVSKSQRHLAAELAMRGYAVSHKLVGRLLKRLGFSLQANRKTREGTAHPDRNAQFEYINAAVGAALAAGEPAISVDTKKKELVGDFKNGGRELRRQRDPEPVRVHDFRIPELGKAVPYGVYDIAANTGWVNLGIDHDTAVFAVESIRRWWYALGHARYPIATRLLITADCGGSNGPRLRLWKTELQKLANETDITITVAHLPPGTSKWNRIEHRLFAYITQNWRGKPLVTLAAIVQLIAATTTRTGLAVHCTLDTNSYPDGIAVSDAELAAVNITPATFHGEWNYTIKPND